MNSASATLNLWSVVFIAGIAQGLFLLGLFLVIRWKNPFAARLLAAILFLAILTDVDYLIVASGLYRAFPFAFGISFGFMFLFGPLLYLYARSVMARDFVFTPALLWHLLPFFLYKLLTLPLFLIATPMKVAFIDAFVLGTLPLRPIELGTFIVQVCHMAAYLIVTIRLLRTDPLQKSTLLVPVELRRGWLKILLGCFVFFLVSIVLLLAHVTYYGVYSTTANYLFATVLSVIIFIISYAFALRREVVAPDHAGKYSSAIIPDETRAGYSSKIKALMETEQTFLDPELTLAGLAQRLEIAPHTLSRIINEEHSKNFFDFINGYRVEEVKKRLTDPQHEALSILGIAMDAGFNTKSSFNAALKKYTGMTPTEYKNSLKVSA